MLRVQSGGLGSDAWPCVLARALIALARVATMVLSAENCALISESSELSESDVLLLDYV